MRLPINEQISQSSFIFYLVDYDLYFIIDAFPLGVTDKKNIKSITSLLVTQQLVSMTLIMTFHASRWRPLSFRGAAEGCRVPSNLQSILRSKIFNANTESSSAGAVLMEKT